MLGNKITSKATIGIVALSSSHLDPAQIEKGKKYLENFGHKVIIHPYATLNTHFFPGTIAERAQQLTDMFSDPEIDMIMCLKGGYGSIQILSSINYDIIKKNPKVFVGFSDLTSVLNTFAERLGLICFQGPMLVSNFGQDSHSLQTDKSFFSIISGERQILAEEFEILCQGKEPVVSGTMLGGNLITFMCLMGTEFEPNLKDSILFFEDIDEKTYSIDRALTQLINHKDINKVKAIVFGNFNDCITRNEHELPLPDLFNDRLAHLNIPIITGVPSGHCHPMDTMPIGAKVKLDLTQKTLSLEEKVVK
ncbi:MAG: S66 peptidase family protein [Brevinema sp.]